MIIKERRPAEQLFLQFCEGYKNRDLAYLLNLFTLNATLWGSGIDEYRLGLNQIQTQLERDWAQSEQGMIEVVSFVSNSDNSLWTAALCNAQISIAGVTHIFAELRGTIILKQVDNQWKIAHMHASFPDYRNAENGSFPIN